MTRCACCGQIIGTSTRRAAFRVDEAVLAICNHAYDLARAAGAASVDVDHLVLALALDRSAAGLLSRRGVDPVVAARAARDRVEANRGTLRACDGAVPRPSASVAMQAVLAASEQLATSDGRAFADVADLVEVAGGTVADWSAARVTQVGDFAERLSIADNRAASVRTCREAWRVSARWAGAREDERAWARYAADDLSFAGARTFNTHDRGKRGHPAYEARAASGSPGEGSRPDASSVLLDRLAALEAELAALRQTGALRQRARRKTATGGDTGARRGTGADGGGSAAASKDQGETTARTTNRRANTGSASQSAHVTQSSRSSISFRSSLRRRRLGGKRVLLATHPLIAERERRVAADRARRADRAAQSGLRFSVPDRASFVAANGDLDDDDFKTEIETDGDDAPPGTERQKRFYLALDDDIVKAPSIGPRTADRLIRAGLITVRDLLAADPSDVAAVAGTRFITARRIADWQAQARLVCVIPWLRGTHAQLLVGAGFASLQAIVDASPDAISAAILKFAASRDGLSILRAGPPPDVERIHRWVANAALAEPVRAA